MPYDNNYQLNHIERHEQNRKFYSDRRVSQKERIEILKINKEITKIMANLHVRRHKHKLNLSNVAFVENILKHKNKHAYRQSVHNLELHQRIGQHIYMILYTVLNFHTIEIFKSTL
jgi:endo-alpha-1,4-polygalactosaminidase (GH114 family)